MSEINTPKEVVPDDEFVQISPELATYYSFDEELYDEEMTEQDDEEAAIVANYASYINMAEIEAAAQSGNIAAPAYLPPQIIRISNTSYSRGADGTTYVDYEFEVESIAGATGYEIRVLEME